MKHPSSNNKNLRDVRSEKKEWTWVSTDEGDGVGDIRGPTKEKPLRSRFLLTERVPVRIRVQIPGYMSSIFPGRETKVSETSSSVEVSRDVPPDS